ncbi:MAG: alkaline phosphatase D family protein [Bacteriovoracaceae bacterium]
MKLISTVIFLTFAIGLNHSCSSSKRPLTVVDDNLYLDGLFEYQEGEKEKAFELFKKACQDGVLAACSALGNVIDDEKLLRVSVLQGATDEKSTQINFLTNKENELHKDLNILIWDGDKLLPVDSFVYYQVQRSHSEFVINKLEIPNLSVGKTYRLEILGTKSTLLDVRFFNTINAKGNSLKFAVASCMSDEYPEAQEIMWNGVLKSNPEAIFLIGDNVYADRVKGEAIREGVGEATLWERYADHRNLLSVFFSSKLIPIYAVWDDHDYGINNGDRYFVHKAEAHFVFDSFYSQKSNTLLKEAHGVGSHLKIRGQNFYFLDNRSFRDPAEDKSGGHFGDEQEKWLFSSLKKNRETSWLISGDQFFGAYHRFESYEGQHGKSFDNFLSNIKKTKRRVFFLSGDRHSSELMKIEKEKLGFETYELTTSPIHSKVYPGGFKKFSNPRQIVGVDDQVNYAIVTSQTLPKDWKVSVKLYGKTGKNQTVLFKKDLAIKK